MLTVTSSASDIFPSSIASATNSRDIILVTDAGGSFSCGSDAIKTLPVSASISKAALAFISTCIGGKSSADVFAANAPTEKIKIKITVAVIIDTALFIVYTIPLSSGYLPIVKNSLLIFRRTMFFGKFNFFS